MSSVSPPPPSSPSRGLILGITIGVTVFSFICWVVYKNIQATVALKNQDSRFITIAMAQFLDDMEREKPIRFTTQQLRISTDNFNHILGSGAFGIVYKGVIGNNRHVAVKVLNGTSNQQIEEQFMAEMSTMGRTHHFNLYMANGSLDNHLFKGNKEAMIGFEKLHEIAVGAARGITYLHEECAQRIVHYDIKPGNILLDSNFCAKVADFGLAKLCNRDNTHITMTRGRGTPDYAAPDPLNPFTHLFLENNESNDFYGQMALNVGGSDWSSFEVVTRSSEITETPLMRRYEITSASE
ncbi:putative protein kinase RLK-Pelle-RLCK-Os family [Helianthus annuus]|nr:putative protein kinase RLK-Pelle-RLCK-Os family [Helianthus annuus]